MVVQGEDKGAAKTLKGVENASAGLLGGATNAEKAVGRLSSALSGQLGPAGSTVERVINKLGSSALSSGSLMSKMWSMQASGATVAAGGVAALGVAVGAFALEGVSKFVALTAEVRKVQGALGSTAEEASRLRNVSAELGTDTDTLVAGLNKLSVNLSKTGGDFSGVHVEIAKNAQGSTDLFRTLMNVRAAYQDISDPMERTRFLQDAMSKGGVNLRTVMSLTNEEFDKFAKRGPLFNDADITAGRNLAIAQRNLKSAVDELQVSLAAGLVPVLTRVSDALAGVVRLSGSVGGVFGKLGLDAKQFLGPFTEVLHVLDLLPGSQHGSAQAAAEATAELDKEAAALDKVYAATLGLVSAQLGYEASLNSLRDNEADLHLKEEALAAATRDHGASSREAELAGRLYRDSLQAIETGAWAAATALFNQAEQQATLEGRTISAEEKTQFFVSTLRDLAAQASGPSRDAINGLADAIENNLHSKTVTVHADTDPALAAIRNLVNSLPSDMYSVVHALAPSFTGRASGGLIGLAGGGNTGRGFVTNGPQFLVGEGRRQYPEAVIPTDPQYQGNALALWSWAGKRIGALASGGTTGAGAGPVAAGVVVTFEPGSIVAHGVENIDQLADRIMVALQRKLRYRPSLGFS
jgi:hypothetical protein